MNNVTRKASQQALSYGIQIEDVRIKRADLPTEVQQSVSYSKILRSGDTLVLPSESELFSFLASNKASPREVPPLSPPPAPAPTNGATQSVPVGQP